MTDPTSALCSSGCGYKNDDLLQAIKFYLYDLQRDMPSTLNRKVKVQFERFSNVDLKGSMKQRIDKMKKTISVTKRVLTNIIKKPTE